jgi:hypothetical protein
MFAQCWNLLDQAVFDGMLGNWDRLGFTWTNYLDTHNTEHPRSFQSAMGSAGYELVWSKADPHLIVGDLLIGLEVSQVLTAHVIGFPLTKKRLALDLLYAEGPSALERVPAM